MIQVNYFDENGVAETFVFPSTAKILFLRGNSDHTTLCYSVDKHKVTTQIPVPISEINKIISTDFKNEDEH